MTGPHESILGRRIDRVLTTTLTFRPEFYEVASSGNKLNGVVLDIDPAAGRADSIERFCLTSAEVDQLAKS